jgi:hypothetical protein
MLELWDGTRNNSQIRVQMKSTCTIEERRQLLQLNASGAMDLERTILSTNFKWPTTFGRRHHSPT